MPLYQAVVLAVVQGLTEFLPISSTAHLALFPWVLHWKDPGLTFDVALHFGTLIAVVVFFWRLWSEMILAGLGLANSEDPEVRQSRRVFWLLVLGTIPGGAAGLLFERAAESQLRQPWVIGWAMIVVGMLMWVGERLGSRKLEVGQIGLAGSLWVGVAQGFAVIPGVSRSGITMATGLFRNMTREASARFSFLLSTPIIAGAALKKALEIHRAGLPAEMRLPFLLGVVVAALVGYIVIGFLVRFLERRSFMIFVIYRLAMGMILLAVGWGLRH